MAEKKGKSLEAYSEKEEKKEKVKVNIWLKDDKLKMVFKYDTGVMNEFKKIREVIGKKVVFWHAKDKYWSSPISTLPKFENGLKDVANVVVGPEVRGAFEKVKGSKKESPAVRESEHNKYYQDKIVRAIDILEGVPDVGKVRDCHWDVIATLLDKIAKAEYYLELEGE